MGKSERVEGQESPHTADGPTGDLCTATFVNVGCNSNNTAEHKKTSTDIYTIVIRLQYCQLLHRHSPQSRSQLA
jgi:hypothetical protein